MPPLGPLGAPLSLPSAGGRQSLLPNHFVEKLVSYKALPFRAPRSGRTPRQPYGATSARLRLRIISKLPRFDRHFSELEG